MVKVACGFAYDYDFLCGFDRLFANREVIHIFHSVPDAVVLYERIVLGEHERFAVSARKLSGSQRRQIRVPVRVNNPAGFDAF